MFLHLRLANGAVLSVTLKEWKKFLSKVYWDSCPVMSHHGDEPNPRGAYKEYFTRQRGEPEWLQRLK